MSILFQPLGTQFPDEPETGGSQIILSPVGSKAVALGMLMAALDRGFAVVSVESIAYKPNPEIFASPSQDGEFVHIWLQGDAYPQVNAQWSRNHDKAH